MGKIFFIISIMLGIIILWSLPAYILGNFLLWAFHIPFHLTFIQSIALSLFITAIHDLLKGDK